MGEGANVLLIRWVRGEVAGARILRSLKRGVLLMLAV